MANFNVSSCLERLRPYIIRTPLVEVEHLSAQTGKRIFLKIESLQKTRAFKFRGAMNFLLTMSGKEAESKVITASSGSHGLGLALSGKILGLECIVVMPKNASLVKQERAKGYGATVLLHGSCYDEAREQAELLSAQEGYVYVPSFNHPRIIEGQATILAEILADRPETDVVFAPVGGGGLVAGLLLAKEQLCSKVAIIGVEPNGAACMQASVDAGILSTLSSMHTIADGVAVRTPGELTFAIVHKHKPALHQVSDEDIRCAQKDLLSEMRVVVETAGAVAVAGMRTYDLPSSVKNIVCIVSGSNVDTAEIAQLLI
ncbi:MAG: threonine/serine dehydratase [Peptococcaceae bacterium]|nr:threonine/serine dehydratase [Peptococcaceae bacterium]